jgi:hypothetical protein
MKKCPNCGALLGSGANRRNVGLASAAIVVALLAAVILMVRAYFAAPIEELDLPISTVAPTEFFVDDPEAIQTLPALPEEGEIYESANTEQPLPVMEADLSMPYEEAEKMVLNVSDAAARYFESYRSNVDYVTKNGLLYENPSQIYITPAHLAEIEGFDPQYKNERAMILYMKNLEFASFIDMGASDPEELYVYAAYETENGCLVAGNGQAAVITKGLFDKIFASYSSVHGQISRISSNSEEFYKVLSTVESEAGVSGPFDVRSMQTDGKYVSLVLSPQNSPLALKEFILENRESSYIIRMDLIEELEGKIVSINQKIPDCNLQIIPPYELSSNRRYLVSNFTHFVESLRSSGMISDTEGNVVFISGNDEFVFIEFEHGLHILGNCSAEGEWKIYPVMTYDEAVNRMKELSKFNPPPYFLIKQG